MSNKLLAAAAACGIIALGMGLWATGRDAPSIPLCRGGDAQITTIWNNDVVKRTETAFRNTNNPLSDGA